MSVPSDLEREMREALFKRKVKAKQTAVTPGMTVITSVRHKWGGPVFRKAYYVNTISLFEARLEAEKQIRKDGLVHWAWLGEEKGNTTKEHNK